MKNKSIILAAILLFASTTGAFAFGVGLQANANAGKVFASGLAVTFKTDSVPLIFAVNYYAGSDVQIFGFTGDYWVVNDKITTLGTAGDLNWFAGVGFFGNLTFVKDEDVSIAGGIRIPLGLNMFLGKGKFEPYLQVSPSFGIRFIPSLGAEDLFFPVSAGFRIWFK